MDLRGDPGGRGPDAGRYAQRLRITTDLPEPTATRSPVLPGDRLEPIAARIYRQGVEPGRDLRCYANVIHYVMKRRRYRLERVLIVGDAPAACIHNHGNAIHGREYQGQTHDTELLDLSQYLATLANAANMRRIEKRNWRTQG